MPNRLTKIFTRTGDEGYTSLADVRHSKDELIIEALGNIDELNSSIGFIIAMRPQNEAVESYLTQIQQDLFDFGAELHVPERVCITAEKVTWLETTLKTGNSTLPPLKEFLLPRGNPASAASHLARTICRRAERSFVRLHRQVTLANPEMLRYLNRLSDLLFVTARLLAKVSREEELMWDKDK
jgi:cob(I)alamin adenosyltransferase